MPLPGFLSRAEIARIAAQVIGDRVPGQVDQDILEASPTPRFALGSRLSPDGKSVFRYDQAGATPLTIATLQQAPVPEATHTGLVPVGTYAAGAKAITLTLGAVGVTQNQYAGGHLFIGTGTGAGQKFKIVSHPAAIGLATCTFVIEKGIVVATGASSRFALVANPCVGTIIQPGPPTAHLVGVTNIPVPAYYYYWAQTGGPAAVLTNGAVLLGKPVEAGLVAGSVRNMSNHLTTGGTPAADSVAGALALTDQGAEGVLRLMDTIASTTYNIGQVSRRVGHVLRVGADTQYSLIDLTLEL